jgi:hypothetical protein
LCFLVEQVETRCGGSGHLVGAIDVQGPVAGERAGVVSLKCVFGVPLVERVLFTLSGVSEVIVVEHVGAQP